MEGELTCSECRWWKQVDFKDVERGDFSIDRMSFGVCTGNGLEHDGHMWRNCNGHSWYARLREDAHACPNFKEERGAMYCPYSTCGSALCTIDMGVSCCSECMEEDGYCPTCCPAARDEWRKNHEDND